MVAGLGNDEVVEERILGLHHEAAATHRDDRRRAGHRPRRVTTNPLAREAAIVSDLRSSRSCGSATWTTKLQADRRRPVAVEHVDRVDEADLLGLVAHHERMGPGAAAEVPDALEQVAGRDAGRREDEV